MFKTIQWTFSILFLNSNYLVSLHQCLFLRLGTVGTVSGSVKATRRKLTLKSVTVPATSAPCKLNTSSGSGETFMWPQRGGLSNKSFTHEQVFEF